MEDFGSRDEVPLETCLEALEGCDLYVLLLGSRFGSLEPSYNLSYTNIEYERARELRMWVLAFVADQPDEPTNDVDPEDFQRLQEFRATIERAHVVRRPYFKTPTELAVQVSTDVQVLLHRISIRPRFGRGQRSIDAPHAYAGRGVRYTRLRAHPLVVIVADLSVMGVESYPDGRGRRMRGKVREVMDFLEREGANALVFNDLPATGSEAIIDQRTEEARRTASVIVALVHGATDAENLKRFLGADARVAAWYPDHIAAPVVEGVRLASYTQPELQHCGLALNVQRYLDSVIDEHVAASLR